MDGSRAETAVPRLPACARRPRPRPAPPHSRPLGAAERHRRGQRPVSAGVRRHACRQPLLLPQASSRRRASPAVRARGGERTGAPAGRSGHARHGRQPRRHRPVRGLSGRHPGCLRGKPRRLGTERPARDRDCNWPRAVGQHRSRSVRRRQLGWRQQKLFL